MGVAAVCKTIKRKPENQFQNQKISLPAKENQEIQNLKFQSHDVLQSFPYYSTEHGEKASFTVEASIGLPILIFFLAFLVFFFRIFIISQTVEESLAYAGRTLAAQAVEKDGGLVEAKILFLSKAGKKQEIKDFVLGGVAGISLAKSKFTETEVQLHAVYIISFPIHFFGMENFPMSQTIICRKWNGQKEGYDTTEKMVYITPYGSVYHQSKRCRYLDLSIQQIKKSEVKIKRNKNGGKYKKCGRCCEGTAETYFITDYGTEYHQKLSCSALKRTIYMVPLSQVKGRDGCGKCGGS